MSIIKHFVVTNKVLELSEEPMVDMEVNLDDMEKTVLDRLNSIFNDSIQPRRNDLMKFPKISFYTDVGVGFDYTDFGCDIIHHGFVSWCLLYPNSIIHIVYEDNSKIDVPLIEFDDSFRRLTDYAEQVEKWF